MPSSAWKSDRSEEHTSELQSHSHLVACRIIRSEEHTSELQSHSHLVCRLLLEKKKKTDSPIDRTLIVFHTLSCALDVLRDAAVCAPSVMTCLPYHYCSHVFFLFFFFFNDTATTEIYTLSLHDALPILLQQLLLQCYFIYVDINCWLIL